MDESIRDHLDAIDCARDVPRLLGTVEFADGTHAAGREWVRRWGPTQTLAVVPACACAAGRCGICN